MEIEHSSHGHPLLELESAAKQGGGTISCDGCLSDINGPAFGCKGCGFYLHKHCAELPLELIHPCDPDVRLKLQFCGPDSQLWHFSCLLCNNKINEKGFVYICAEVILEILHVDCALKPSLKHPLHKHPLVIMNKQLESDNNCAACGARFKDETNDVYGCCKCEKMFHKECLDMPAQIKREDLHSHDLTLQFKPITPEDYGGWIYYCDACNKQRDIRTFSYACTKCNYICHLRCDLFKNVKRRISMTEMKHFSHEHPLFELECTKDQDEETGTIISCAGCRLDINGPAFGCEECGFYLHKHCADHLPLLPQLEPECSRNQCPGLQSVINYGPACLCDECESNLLKSIDGLPYTLDHPLHPKSPLWRERCYLDASHGLYPKCKLCYNRIYPGNYVYMCRGECQDDECCEERRVRLHVGCALKPSLKLLHHDHPLVWVNEEGFISEKCAACRTKFEFKRGGTCLYRCPKCGDRFHEECLDLPARIKRENQHPHVLTLITEPEFHGQHRRCDACNEVKDPTEFYYACRKCPYAWHIRCVLFKNAQKRIIPTMLMPYFTHDHPLFELEFTEEQGEGTSLCFGCQLVISGPGLGCDGCGFYLHKHCTNLPRKVHHPCHPSDPLRLELWPPNHKSTHGYICSVCYLMIYDPTFVYMCNGDCSRSECKGLRIHKDCALKPSLKYSTHKHPLVYIRLEEDCHVNCVACRTKFEFKGGRTYLYLCQICGDRFHKECAESPDRVKREDLHRHDLILHFDPLPKDHDDRQYYCDDCEKKRDIQAFSYACIDCDLCYHIQCGLFNNAQKVKDEEEERECDVLLAREEEQLDDIKEKIKFQEEQLRATLSEKSARKETIKRLQERRDCIRERIGRNYSTT